MGLLWFYGFYSVSSLLLCCCMVLNIVVDVSSFHWLSDFAQWVEEIRYLRVSSLKCGLFKTSHSHFTPESCSSLKLSSSSLRWEGLNFRAEARERQLPSVRRQQINLQRGNFLMEKFFSDKHMKQSSCSCCQEVAIMFSTAHVLNVSALI